MDSSYFRDYLLVYNWVISIYLTDWKAGFDQPKCVCWRHGKSCEVTRIGSLCWGMTNDLPLCAIHCWHSSYTIEIIDRRRLHLVFVVYMSLTFWPFFFFSDQVSFLKSLPLRFYANMVAFHGIPFFTILDWACVTSFVFFSDKNFISFLISSFFDILF